jgi:hypothetical protein
MFNPTQETIDAMKGAQVNALSDGISKAYTQATGLVNYDLQPVALNLYPVLTPLRNRIPRVSGDGGTATNWKAVTGINTTNISIGVSEGQRGGVQTQTTVDKTAAYRGIGLEDSVTFEADYAGTGFDDIKAKAAVRLLQSVMVAEERLLTGGNSSIALGVTPTATVVGSGTGGTLAAQTMSVICVALTLEGLRASTVSGGLPLSGTRTNADASTDSVNAGTAQKSASATAVLSGSTSSATATVTVVNGAVAYAWFWGVAGSELLGAITSLNTVAITAAATGTQNASAGFTADKSANSLVFDGLLTQIQTVGSGAYVVSLPTLAGVGTALTSDGAGGIVEIETAFDSFWTNYRLSPSDIDVSGKTLLAMNKLIIANGGAPLIRYTNDNLQGGQMTAGTVIASYLNKITNTTVKINVMPEMPDGMVMFFSRSVSYPLNGVGNILQVKTRRDYYQTEWPLRTRKYEYGVYADQLLQNYFPPAFGLIRNVKV